MALGGRNLFDLQFLDVNLFWNLDMGWERPALECNQFEIAAIAEGNEGVMASDPWMLTPPDDRKPQRSVVCTCRGKVVHANDDVIETEGYSHSHHLRQFAGFHILLSVLIPYRRGGSGP